MPRATQTAARNARPKRIDAGGSVASPHALRRGGPSRTSPTTLTKQKTASAAVAARPARATATEDARQDTAGSGDVEERLQRQPFGGEPVQRGQSGDGCRSDEERGPGPRHAPQQPAEPIEIERSDRPLERPRAEEEQRLEDGMVDRVQQSGSQRERRPLVTRDTLCPQQQAGSDTEQDDADVLDRVEREQLA